MLKIYFDDSLVNENDYIEISNSFKLFEEKFMLGTTAANTMKIQVPLDYPRPNQVKITYNDADYANLIVDKYDYIDDFALELTLVDKMVLLNDKIDFSDKVPITTKQLYEEICNKFGIEKGTENFTNDDIVINEYDSEQTARQYLSYISEVSGGYAQIGKDGKLYIKDFKKPAISFDIESCEDFKFGDIRKITRLVFDNGLLKYETSDNKNLDTLYLNSDNPFINSQEIFEKIANKIIGFTFINFETGNCDINPDLLAGDLIKFEYKGETTQTIVQYDLEYNGGWLGGYSLNVNSKKQEETEQLGVNTKIKSIKVNLDRINSNLNIAVLQINKNESDITELNITSNEINNKVSSIEIDNKDVNNKINNINETLNQTKLDLNGFNIDLNKIKGEVNANTSEIDKSKEQIINMNYKFTTDDLSIAKESDKVNAKISNKGVKVYTYNKLNSIFNHNGAGFGDLVVTGNAQLGRHRVSKGVRSIDGVQEEATLFYYLENLYQTPEDLEVTDD